MKYTLLGNTKVQMNPICLATLICKGKNFEAKRLEDVSHIRFPGFSTIL